MEDDKTVFQPGPSGSIRPGVRLNGTYEVERLIAEGGMGEVYKGFNIQTGDPVAIKVIRTELSRNPEAFALFRREASTLNNLHHDAIVRYYVFSIDPDLQRAYLAMEFVDGPSLAKRISSAPLTLAEVDVFRTRLGSALDVAHRRGVIHRDISSDNFILPDGDVASAKIIDFGIARSNRPGEGTIIGDGFAGKYNYVSPEQLGLFGGNVTAKSDIYSFGLVLAEASRGRRIDMDGSQIEVIEKRRKVPDLSEVHPSLKPLLQAMLQPNPANRPADMAAVVDWRIGPKSPDKPKGGGGASRSPSGGPLAAAVGALILVASLGTTAYVFRDDLKAALGPLIGAPLPEPTLTSTPRPTGIPTPGPIKTSTPVPIATPIPGPIATPTAPATPGPTATSAPTPIATSAPEPTVTPQPTGTSTPGPVATNTTVPGKDDILKTLPPSAPESPIQLPPAIVGTPYLADIPPFKDRSGGGLLLEADPAPPEGLSFKDSGDGTAEISGSPSKAGAVAFDIVATNHNGRSARVTARIVVAERVRPIRPTQSTVTLEGATVGTEYTADLPPFDPGGDSRGFVLHAEPSPPAGLSFIDENGGLGRLSGKPTRAGSYDFEVVATDASGQSARMAVKIVVAPEPSQDELVDAFLRAYNYGPCFLVRRSAPADGAKTLDAIGDDAGAFQRFQTAYKQVVGAVSPANFKAILPPQCPALQLLKLSASGIAPEPRVELTHFEVGGALPLTGTVSGVAGRRLALLIIGEDGAVYHIATKPTPGGDVAAFSEELGRVDDSSVGPLQLLLAVVSDKPLAALEGFKTGAIGDLAPKLIAEWERAGASAKAGFFKLRK